MTAPLDLDQALEQLHSQWAQRPFVWGASDCCQWAAAAVRRIHGLEVYIEPYGSERSALRVLKALGTAGNAMRALGLAPRTSVQAAQRGDVVVIKHDGSADAPAFAWALAVCFGVQAYTTSATGLVAVPRSQWLQSWGLA